MTTRGKTRIPVLAIALLTGSSGLLSWPGQAASQGSDPQPRAGHRAAYHGGLGGTVVFGGRDSTGVDLSDTWVWDGRAWTLLDEGLNGPPPRARHAMAYDRARNRIVIHGGGSTEADLGDTWVWSGGRWTELAAEGPSPRSHHHMAYDRGSGRVVLYGGGREAGGFGSEVWTLNERGWRLNDARLRPGRVLGGTTSAEGGILLFGGLVRGGPRSDELWEWRGEAWHLVGEGGPTGALSPGLAWDEARAELVLFGGESADGLLGETWIWEDSRWRNTRVAEAPQPRTEHTLVYDRGRSVVVLFGGRTAAGPVNDVWEWDGETWRRAW